MAISADDLSFLERIIRNKHASIAGKGKRPDPFDTALLGLTLLILKRELTGQYEAFVEERLPFSSRQARRFVAKSKQYLLEQFDQEELEAKAAKAKAKEEERARLLEEEFEKFKADFTHLFPGYLK